MRKACGLVIVLTVLSCASYHSSTDDSRGPATAAVQALLSGSMPYRGVNLNGADFGSAQLPGIFGIDYTYPDPTYVSGYNSADYFISKGMNTFRLPFRWERLQPTRGQAFDADELERLRTTVTHLTGKGAHVILDPHNFARYGTALIGSAIPHADFADFWARLATEFQGNAKVLFGLMNKPHDMPTKQWVDAANTAISAIRSAGATNLILVPGNAWTGAWVWSQNYYGTPNAIAMLNITDPGNNVAYEVHQYLDSDASGTSSTCVSRRIGSERMQDFTNWLRLYGKKGFVGEFGGGSNKICLAAIDKLLDHLDRNADVYLGWTYWAAGPWRSNGRRLEHLVERLHCDPPHIRRFRNGHVDGHSSGHTRYQRMAAHGRLGQRRDHRLGHRGLVKRGNLSQLTVE